MAKVDKDTQTREYYENLEKSRRREKLKTTTDKVLEGMEAMLLREVAALEKFVADKTNQANEYVNSYLEKTWKISENIERRAKRRDEMDRDVARLVTKRISEEKSD